MRGDGKTMGWGAGLVDGTETGVSEQGSVDTHRPGIAGMVGSTDGIVLAFQGILAGIRECRGKEIASNGRRLAELDRLLCRVIAHERAAREP